MLKINIYIYHGILYSIYISFLVKTALLNRASLVNSSLKPCCSKKLILSPHCCCTFLSASHDVRSAEFINTATATGGRDCRAGAFYHFQVRHSTPTPICLRTCEKNVEGEWVATRNVSGTHITYGELHFCFLVWGVRVFFSNYYGRPGDHRNQDASYTQKPIYSCFFTKHIWSWLLCSPVYISWYIRGIFSL